MLSAYPRLAQYRKVEKRATQAHNVLASAVGKPFRDFEATADGVTRRLSDYVGRGQYVLADFWASWCQPCRREVPGLKELYSQYKDSGLIILGVAVWDKPEDTERAIRELDIPWPCIINAGNVPAELYGIKAIPYFILFAPDGTIAARGLRGDALREAIASALGK